MIGRTLRNPLSVHSAPGPTVLAHNRTETLRRLVDLDMARGAVARVRLDGHQRRPQPCADLIALEAVPLDRQQHHVRIPIDSTSTIRDLETSNIDVLRQRDPVLDPGKLTGVDATLVGDRAERPLAADQPQMTGDPYRNPPSYWRACPVAIIVSPKSGHSCQSGF